MGQVETVEDFADHLLCLFRMVHGRNRLMGNSLLDIIVFGRDAGKHAAELTREVELGTPNLDHVEKFAEELEAAGIHTDRVSPLLLPPYARRERSL